MSLYLSIDGDIRDLPDDLVSAWDSADNPKRGEWTLLPPQPSAEAQWNGAEWVIPARPVPESVSARQIRLWLIQHGVSLSQVDAAIDAIQDPLVRDSVRVEWEYAPYVERAHPMLAAIAQSLGLSEAETDAAFLEAANL